MKYVCFGYLDEEAWAAMSESEQQRFVDKCFAYDDLLRKNGQSILGGEALQTVQNAKTVHFRNGKVMITDGPYAETKEQFGGYCQLGVVGVRWDGLWLTFGFIRHAFTSCQTRKERVRKSRWLTDRSKCRPTRKRL
jgi:hypothetical protein